MNKNLSQPVRTKCFQLLCWILLFGLYHEVVQAQVTSNQERGLTGESYLSDTIDHVNLYNGNLSLTIPIGKPYTIGGPLSYHLSLVYNSNVWDFKSVDQLDQLGNLRRVTKATPNRKTNAGLGWYLSLGALYFPQTPGFNETGFWVYVGPDGSEHRFYESLRNGLPVTPNILYTRDSTYLRLNVAQRTIEFPDGEIHSFNTDGPLGKITDRFGNSLTVDRLTTPGTWLLKDQCKTCGSVTRTHKIVFNATGQVGRVELAAFNSATPAVYQFVYASESIERHRKNTYDWARDPSGQVLAPVTMLRQVILPISAGVYSFEYYLFNAQFEGVSGSVKSAVLPSGGSYEWDYMQYVFPNTDPICNPPCLDPGLNSLINDGVKVKRIFNDPGRTDLAGTFQYRRELSAPTTFNLQGHVTTIVKTPNGNESKYYFNISRTVPDGDSTAWDYSLPYSPLLSITTPSGPMYLSEEHFEGAVSNNNKERSIYLRYDADETSPSTDDSFNTRQAAQRTIYLDDFDSGAGTFSFTDSVSTDFDGVGHYRTNTVSGSFGNERTSTTQYRGGVPASSSTWLLNLYTEQQVQEAGVTVATQYDFDEAKGVLNRKRILKGNGNVSSQDILVQYRYDTDGNATDVEYYGGDKQAGLPQISSLDNVPFFASGWEYKTHNTYEIGLLKTSEDAGAGFFKVNQITDPNTGLVMDSFDSSNLRTTFTYDAMGRVLTVKPEQEATAEFSYFPAQVAPLTGALNEGTAGRMEIRQKNGSNVLTETSTYFDRFGRVWRLKERQPGGSLNMKETLYDLQGWKLSESEWMPDDPNILPTDANYKKTDYLNYDAFGRARLVRPPDSNSQNNHEIYFNYNGVRKASKTTTVGMNFISGQVIESDATKIETYDQHGRLVSVDEPSGLNGATVATRYQYDTGNRLKEVRISNTAPAASINWASAANGAIARPSTELAGYPASAVIDGDRKGINWGNGGGWNDATQNAYPDSVEISFAGDQLKSIDRINVFTLQDNYTNPLEPTPAMTFSLYGIRRFQVQYWQDATASWVDVPSGNVLTDNTQVWRSFTFSPITTRKIRVQVNKGASAAPLDYSRIVEVEAIESRSQQTATQVRTFTYDNRGFLSGERHPELGASGNGIISYSDYDTMGNPGRKVDGSNTLRYSYDAAKRLTLVEEQINSTHRPIKEFTYYNTNPSATNRGLGKMRTAKRHNYIPNPFNNGLNADLGITETYEYRGTQGRLSNLKTEWSSGPRFEQTFTYDVMGQLVSQTYPQCTDQICGSSGESQVARTVNYSYERGRLKRITGQQTAPAIFNQVTYASNITYHPNRMTNQVFHGNGATDTYGIDANLMPRIASVNVTTSNGIQNWSSGAYKFDGTGNITRIGADWYLYDGANRLTEGTAISGTRQKQKYVYDSVGNLQAIQTFSNASSTTESPGVMNVDVNVATNRIRSYEYDLSGNQLSPPGNGKPLSYDAVNMVKTSPGRIYLYAADDERVEVVKLGKPEAIVETFTLRGLNKEVLREYELVGGNALNHWSWKKDYIYREGKLLASEEAAPMSSTRKDYHVDHLGTARVITDSNGQRLATNQLLPFGEDVTSGLPDNLRLKFTGHERDALDDASTLDYMHARYYMPTKGRFMSIDPGRDFDMQNPQSWNLYAYVRNSPVGRTDPTGRASQETAEDKRNNRPNRTTPADGDDEQTVVNIRDFDNPLEAFLYAVSLMIEHQEEKATEKLAPHIPSREPAKCPPMADCGGAGYESREEQQKQNAKSAIQVGSLTLGLAGEGIEAVEVIASVLHAADFIKVGGSLFHPEPQAKPPAPSPRPAPRPEMFPTPSVSISDIFNMRW